MSKHMARDEALWNRLYYGNSRRPVPMTIETFPSEKQKPRPARSGRKLEHILLLLVLAVFGSYYSVKSWPMGCSLSHSAIAGHRTRKYSGVLDGGSYAEAQNEPKEVFEVSYPYIPKKSYGEPVYSQLLIDHKFESWGKPKVQAFKPPKDIDFNKVVLTLNTTVDGVQYDRLAHLYVGGAEIWRTSTMEPGRESVFSSFKKDVSVYSLLFHKETDIVFELNNLLSDYLTGVFHVQLQADFYLSEYIHSELLVPVKKPPTDDPEEATYYQYYDNRQSADVVVPLVPHRDSKSLPTVYLPHSSFKVALPQLSQNSTRLKLAIYASGEADEEFWYTNVCDGHQGSFPETELLGHGPMRFVNVWVDGKKVATQTPQPFIFTGGFSPALWKPVVPVNAFDLPSIDLDMTPLLPLLWDNEEHEIRILVDNGFDEVKEETSGIGSNWIISANLLVYQHEDIAHGEGKIVKLDSHKSANRFVVSEPYTGSLNQVVEGKFSVVLAADIVHTLKNGTLLNNTFQAISSTAVDNVQRYTEKGRVHKLSHLGSLKKSFSFINRSGRVVHDYEIATEYPLVLTSKSTPIGDGTDLDVSIVNGRDLMLNVNAKPAMYELNFQNGTSHYHLSPNGNHGTGELDTKYKSEITGPNYGFVYKRHVRAEGGVVVFDEDVFEPQK